MTASKPSEAEVRWVAERTQIREKCQTLRQLLLPGGVWSRELGRERWAVEIAVRADPTPPSEWKCWARPRGLEPIDAAVTTLINKKRLRTQASLGASNIPCPYWYARAGVILAFEAAQLAEIEAADERRDLEQRLEQLRLLIPLIKEFIPRTTNDLTKMVHAREAIEAGVRLNSRAMALSARGQGDELWDRFVAIWNEFCGGVGRIEAACTSLRGTMAKLLEVACEAKSSLVNNQPDVFRRTFAEKIKLDFQRLTGGEPAWGPLFMEFLTAAWNSAGQPQELSGERLVRSLRKIK